MSWQSASRRCVAPERRRSNLDLDGTIAGFADADSLALAVPSHLDERLHGGSLLQPIEPLDASLHFGRQILEMVAAAGAGR